MKHRFLTGAAVAALALLCACQGEQPGTQPIFVEGHAVSMAGDSLYAVTLSGKPGLLVRSRATGKGHMIGADVLHNPAHAQWVEGEWYVSDVDNGKPEIVVLTHEGALKRRIALSRWSDTPHQFAVMPDGAIVIEGRGGKLLSLKGETASTYDTTGAGNRTGLLVAASGGVLYAIPDKTITLYNGFGHVRWRIDWPWANSAFVSDVAVDYNNRIHFMAGVPRDGTFVVYTMSNTSGEAVRWSIPGPKATFTVEAFGNLQPADAAPWTRIDP